jgi:hypothetical protein
VELAMSLLDGLLGEGPEGEKVELVTLTADQLTNGLISGSPRAFPDMHSALEYARTLSADERDASWIRVGDEVKTLQEAEAEDAG